jgi:AcrR family transcriptional regulator
MSRVSLAKPQSATLKQPGSGPLRKPRDEPYHHGDLHQALLSAAETVLERDGLAGLTLRAVAREAGVSHAAPTHHFGDLTGLLSELAAIGFRRFNDTMAAAGAIDGTPMQRGMARAKAYVAYARANPGMYGLMFRTERLDMTRPSLREAADASFAGLAGAVAARRHEDISGDSLTLDQAAEIAKAWSLVHGYTMLVLDGRLHDIFTRVPGADAESLLDAMLRATITPV